MVTTLFVSLFVFILLGVPIGVSVGLSTLLTVAVEGSMPLIIAPQKIINATNTWTLLALPFFMLVGVIMERSTITDRLVAFAASLVGWVRGGMSYVSVFTGMLMGGISGSAPADTAALSGVMIPSMRKLGYPGPFAAALQAASGSIGIIIPPSIPMVILGSVTNISVGALFLGGIVPGVAIGFGLMAVAGFICNRNGYGVVIEEGFSLRKIVRSSQRAILPLIAPVIIVGGILSGIFTATESSVVAVVYTLFLGMVVYRTINWRDLPDIFMEATVSAANVVLIIATSAMFSWFLTKNGVPEAIAESLFAISQAPWFILLAINFIFLLGGMFIEGVALIIMFVPILLPIALKVGIDPVFFGVMVVINIAIGTLTPPVGVCLFVASSAGGENFEAVTRRALPMVAVMVAVLAIMCIYPSLITTIPNSVYK